MRPLDSSGVVETCWRRLAWLDKLPLGQSKRGAHQQHVLSMSFECESDHRAVLSSIDRLTVSNSTAGQEAESQSVSSFVRCARLMPESALGTSRAHDVCSVVLIVSPRKNAVGFSPSRARYASHSTGSNSPRLMIRPSKHASNRCARRRFTEMGKR